MKSEQGENRIFQQLQTKARQSYRRLQRTRGQIEKHQIAFLWIRGSAAAESGVLFPAINSIKQKTAKSFPVKWLCFNQELGKQTPRGTILVVADEIFMMNDKVLQQRARHCLPSVY